MDIKKIYECYQQSYLTDLELIIKDKDLEIKMQIHKLVLYCSCEYFRNLLTKFAEKDQKYINIYVPNASICYDYIMNLYDQKTNYGNLPPWKYQLELAKFYNFLCLPYDTNLLSNLEIPNNEFNYLLGVLDIIGNNDDINITKLVRNNLPKNYNISKFTKEFITNLMYDDDYLIAKKCGNKYDNFVYIKIWNPKNGNLVSEIKIERCSTYNDFLCFSMDNKIITLIDNSNNKGVIMLRDIKSGEYFDSFSSDEYVISLSFSKDNKYIVCSYIKGIIRILDIQNKSVCFEFKMEIGESEDIENIILVDNGKLLFSINSNNKIIKINILDITTKKIIKNIYDVDNTYYLSNHILVCIDKEKNIYIKNMVDDKLIGTIHNDAFVLINHICLSEDMKYIAISGYFIINNLHRYGIQIWDIENEKYIYFIDHYSEYNQFSPDNKLFIVYQNLELKIYDFSKILAYSNTTELIQNNLVLLNTIPMDIKHDKYFYKFVFSNNYVHKFKNYITE